MLEPKIVESAPWVPPADPSFVRSPALLHQVKKLRITKRIVYAVCYTTPSILDTPQCNFSRRLSIPTTGPTVVSSSTTSSVSIRDIYNNHPSTHGSEINPERVQILSYRNRGEYHCDTTHREKSSNATSASTPNGRPTRSRHFLQLHEAPPRSLQRLAVKVSCAT